MSMRGAVVRSVAQTARAAGSRMEGASGAFRRSSGRAPRYFSDDKGRVLSEEERAKEAVYIQKMERERLEKLKKKLEKEKAEAEKKEKKSDEPQKS